MKLLMISMDRRVFEKDSAVAARQIEYAKKYQEVHIIVFSKKGFKESTLGTNIFIYPTNSLSRWLYVFDALRLGRFIVEKRNIEQVTCDNPFETGLVGALIKSRHQVSLELQVHTDIGSKYFQTFTLLNRIRTFVSKFTLRKADHIRVVSNKIKEYLSSWIEPSKIEVRPIAVNVEHFRNPEITTDLHKKYPQFSKIILMVSRLEPEKNIDMAIKALQKVHKNIPAVGMVIVGSGSEEERLRKLAKKLALQNSIIFAGWEKNTAPYYKTCDCFLSTSWYEGYGVVFKEAEAARAKIISTDVGIAKEVGAYIVDWKPESIASAIISTLI